MSPPARGRGLKLRQRERQVRQLLFQRAQHLGQVQAAHGRAIAAQAALEVHEAAHVATDQSVGGGVALGVRHVDGIYIRAARSLGASRLTIFRRVILPAATPYILSGARIGIGAQPAVDRLLKPNIGSELAGPMAAPQAHLEPVSHMWVTKFLRTHGLVHDCPKLVILKSYPTIAIGGDPEGSRGRAGPEDVHL